MSAADVSEFYTPVRSHRAYESRASRRAVRREAVVELLRWRPRWREYATVAVLVGLVLLRYAAIATDRVVGRLARLVVLDLSDLAETWAAAEVAERKRAHVGRHRFDEATWRNRWASYTTQWWPTLATTGDAEELVTAPELSYDGWRYVMFFYENPPIRLDALSVSMVTLLDETPLFDTVAVG